MDRYLLDIPVDFASLLASIQACHSVKALLHLAPHFLDTPIHSIDVEYALDDIVVDPTTRSVPKIAKADIGSGVSGKELQDPRSNSQAGAHGAAAGRSTVSESNNGSAAKSGQVTRNATNNTKRNKKKDNRNRSKRKGKNQKQGTSNGPSSGVT
jgi:Mg-chelatase subunit ChlI